MTSNFSELRLDGVTRRFGAGKGAPHFTALDALTMTVRRGEFIALLGPSGCGKSTALNCIAGLLPVSDGGIWLDATRIDTLPPERRGFGMVFQNYAPFPHMSVARTSRSGWRCAACPAPNRRGLPQPGNPGSARRRRWFRTACGSGLALTARAMQPLNGRRAVLAIRPEEFDVVSWPAENSFAAQVLNVEYCGHANIVDVRSTARCCCW